MHIILESLNTVGRMFDEIIAPLLTTEWGRRAGWGAMIGLALLVVLIFFLALIAWYHDVRLASGQSRPAELALSSDAAAQLVTQIPEQHIFGQSGLTGVLPVTSLQLRLVGVVKADPEKFSRVIISKGDKPGKVYQIGDVLPSGVRVNAIVPDGVVLENGGRLEKLPLQRSPLLFQGMPKPLLQNENAQEE